MRPRFWLFTIFALFAQLPLSASRADSPEVELGERLFKDPRFSYSRNFACVSCHFSPDDRRGYADFEARTPIPRRAEDAHLPQLTLRNTTALIELFWGETPGKPNLLHSDGEFKSPDDLVIAGMTGRNMGWLASEKNQALQRVADIARLYPEIAPTHPHSMPDEEAIQKVASLISAYMRSLEFSKDEQGDFNGSPYDHFLRLNQLPEKPSSGEGPKAYGERLKLEIQKLETQGKLRFVTEGPQGVRMNRHDQAFAFGATELEGLKVFYSTPPRAPARAIHSVGNCAGCHAPPSFTDFRFHNTGASQEEYDLTHGPGSFLALAIPEAAERARLTKEELTRFAAIPDPQNPGQVDLGAWNQLDLSFSDPSSGPGLDRLFGQIFETLCELIPSCTSSQWRAYEAEVLRASIGAFKTPTLRNLGHSNPYLHTGNRSRIEQAVQMYIPMGLMARQRRLRHADPEMSGVIINARDIAPLSAFIRSLNEDYE